jgi:5-formyltetrahydrofolate cyclo-ligase
MGGGYYDKYLSDYQDSKRPFLLGVCFSNQYNNEVLPTEDTDIKLDAVVNEEGLFRFN